MPIALTCPNCGMEFTFSDDLLGHTIRCNSCRATFTVAPPAPPPPSARPRREPEKPRPREQRLQDKPRPAPVVSVPVVRNDPPVARPRTQPKPAPAPKSSGKGALAIVLLLGGGVAALVLLLAVLGIGAWFLLRPGSSSSSNPFASSGGTGAGDVGPDMPALRYRWKGAPIIYHVRAEVDRNDHLEVHEGNCVLTVNPRAPRGVPLGGMERKGSGTGFVINPNGYLLTCAHVVSGATKIEATVGGQTYPAQVVASNAGADVAVIRVNAQNLPSLALANSDAAELGQDVWALGYPLSDVLGSNLKVTRGTLSGVNTKAGRKQLQIDAAINFGNSGGPLVTNTGMVLGVTSAKLAGAAISNVGFASPSNEAKRLLDSKNIQYSMNGWDAKLDGPTLVKRVSVATAFIQVTMGAEEEAETTVLTCNGFLGKSSQGKPGMNVIPPPPAFNIRSNTHSTMEVDSTGQVLKSSGGIQLPCLLGDVLAFVVDPLPEDERMNWESSNRCTIEEGSNGFQGRPFGPMGMPGMPQIPRPFGGPRMPGMGQPNTNTRIGEERAEYTRLPGGGDAVTIRKKYALKVPATAASHTAITLDGSGTIVFDAKQGLARDIEFTAALTLVSGNNTQRLPVTVTCKLLDGAERERILKPPAPPQPPPAAPAAPKDIPAEAGGNPVAGNPAAKPAPNKPTPGPAVPGKVPDTTVTLPGPATTVALAGAGRYIVLHVPSQQQLVVFDVKEARIAKTLPVNEGQVLLAGGRDCVVVYLPGANLLERWSLTTFEREQSIANPVGDAIKNMALGSASGGPLVLHAPTKGGPTLGISFYDPKTFKPSTDTVDAVQGQPFGIKVDPEVACVTASDNGQMILLRGTFEYTILTRRGQSWQGRNFGGATTPQPSSDGQFVIDKGQAYTADGKSVAPKRGQHWAGEWGIPARQGGLTVALTETRQQGKMDWADFQIALHVGGDPTPLVGLPFKIDAVSKLVDWFWGKWPPLERHVFVLPELGVMAVIPKEKDRVDIHRIDFDQLLKEAKNDYLFVFSTPATAAAKGAAYRYPLVVKSKQGGVKSQLISAPPGMTLDATGTLTWTVPADFAASDADVAIAIRDAAGKEIRHTFSIRVTEKQ